VIRDTPCDERMVPMKRLFMALLFVSALALPLGVRSGNTVLAAAWSNSVVAAKHCKSLAYKHGACVVVPSHGKFSIHAPRTRTTLDGTGTPRTAGTEITVVKVAPPCPRKHAQAFRLIATGPMPRLKPTTGTLYKFNPVTGRCKRVTAVTGPGLYEVVFPPSAITRIRSDQDRRISRPETAIPRSRSW
jgi:hypothetical protein